MSDDRDDKLNHESNGSADFSVEEILTEFSSTRNHRDRVVPFPVSPRPAPSADPQDADEQEDDSPPAQTDAPKKTAEIIDLPPENLAFELTEKIRGLFQKADAYAQQMYQQAEPSPEELEAEEYIPGVDWEDPPQETARPPRRRYFRKPPKPVKDIPPSDLAARYSRGLSHSRLRVCFSFFMSLLCTYLSLALPLPALPVSDYAGRMLGCAMLLGITLLLCADVLWQGIKELFTLRPGAETLVTMAGLFTLLDNLTMTTLGTRGDTLPCAAPACFALTFCLWGRWHKQRGDRLSCRTAAQARSPYVVTLDEAKWSGRPAYCKWSGTLSGFGSQVQMPDGAQRLFRISAPLLLLACFLCALLASVGREIPQQFLWAFSSTLTAAASFSAAMVYGLPYHTLAARLSKIGAALAGWTGVERADQGSMVLTDLDLFPPGTVKLNGIKVFGEFPNEKVVAYTATLIRAAGCGLEKPFSDLMKAQNAAYRSAAAVRYHEGGITGIIRNQEIIVGTAAFLHLMNIPMPQGLNVKNAVFCAIDGDLAGIFALHYAMQSAVNPCLTTLMHNQLSPLLATRDPNLIPSLLGQKFKLPVDKMEFPSVDRRLELSDETQPHDDTPIAVLCREGLGPYCDAAVGAKRLRSAVRWNGIFSVTGSCTGVLLTFYLTFVDAYHSLSPAALLVFLFAWLLPVLLLSDWANRY